jgi:hypothetical protein
VISIKDSPVPLSSTGIVIGLEGASQLRADTIASADIGGLLRALDAMPGDAALDAALAQARATAVARLLSDGRAALSRDDLAALVADVERAATARGRQRPDARWRTFEHALRRRAAKATSSHETAGSYALLRAAWAADPQDVWAQHDLERARENAF